MKKKETVIKIKVKLADVLEKAMEHELLVTKNMFSIDVKTKYDKGLWGLASVDFQKEDFRNPANKTYNVGRISLGCSNSWSNIGNIGVKDILTEFRKHEYAMQKIREFLIDLLELTK